jgi:hypothetical protein
VPFAAIKVTAVDGSNVSLATEDGWKRTITVGDGTTVTRAGQTIGVGDLKVGDEVRIGEQRETDGSYTVTRVDVVLPTVAGEVTAKDATSITIKRFDGTTETIHVGSSTTYVTRGNGAASLSDVAVGSAVVAQGTARSDGSLDAERVLVGQPGGIENGIGRGWRFGPGMGGPGRPKAGDPNAPSPSGTPDPSASTSGA